MKFRVFRIAAVSRFGGCVMISPRSPQRTIGSTAGGGRISIGFQMACDAHATDAAPGAGRGRRRPAPPLAPGAHPPTVALLASAGPRACGSASAHPTADPRVPAGYRYAGELTCVIGGGASAILGADRNLVCTFARRGAVAERYEGLSGIVATHTPGAETVAFAVWMLRPEALAALEGDYAGARLSLTGDGALVGGRDDAVVLTPLVGRAATDLEALNALLRLNQLHLNYGGRVPATSRLR